MKRCNRQASRVVPFLFALSLFGSGAASADAISGAIFTTTATGQTVNGNNYAAKEDVYLNGGPNNAPGCSGGELEDGTYYFQVTDPSGDFLLSLDAVGNRKFQVSGGEITANLGSPSPHANGATSPCGSLAIQLMPYDDSPNNGGVYKVWITRVSDFELFCGGIDCGLGGFVAGHTKTDNFRVQGGTTPTGALEAYKFYDANASGTFDAGDLDLSGWPMTLTSLTQGIDSTQSTGAGGTTTWDPLLPDTDYFVEEGTPVQGNWVHSATIYLGHDGSPQNPAGPLAVVAGETTRVAFGNYCTVRSNGRTLGFWSNRNGQVLFGSDDLAAMVALNLRNANGTHFNPASYAAFRTWLLNATATNMAYMLSAQLAAMKLNIDNGFVDAGATYVPAGMTIGALVSAANTALADPNGLTLAGHPQRAYQEQLKNWLDQLNNGAGVLSPTPCTYSFGY
jgi:hypothetical protein